MSDYLKISSKNIHAYIMGEHGDSSFVPWDHAYVGCKKVKDVMKDNNHPMEDLEKIHKGVVDAAYEIIEKKKATYYGIGMAVKRICEAIVRDEKSILPISSMIHGIYGIDDVVLSMPAIVGKDGVETLVPISISSDEVEKLKDSAKTLKEVLEQTK